MRTLPLFLGLIVTLSLAAPAQALDVVVTKNGDTLVYPSGVLGITTEEETEIEAESSFQRSEGTRIRVKTGERSSVQVQNSRNEILTESEDGKVMVQFPAGRSAAQERAQEAREKAQERADQLRKEAALKLEESSATARLIREEAKELRRENKSYIEQIREERQERLEEIVQLRNRQASEGGELMELQSRNVRATIRGAEFTLDPETNTVTLTTPSGQVHELTHLPDQAIARMSERGFFTETPLEGELEIEIDEEGSAVYTAPSTKTKRFLGLFKREIPTEVALEDGTGEVTETEVGSDGFVDQVLDALSF